MDEAMERYQQLDLIYEEVKETGRLRTQKELRLGSWREEQGILINIGPGGEPLITSGFHRFAIVRLLNLRFPAQIGCVRYTALPWLPIFRAESLQTEYSASED